MNDADVIIIGSGAGGMTTALVLARGGKRVLMLEQHYVPGGWCHSFYLDGQRFSPGVHYIGDLGVGQNGRHLLEGLGIANDLTFFQMNVHGYDHYRIGERVVHMPAHRDRVVESMCAAFPHEAGGIRRYQRLLGQVYDELGYALTLSGFRDYIMAPFTMRHLGRTALFSLQFVLNRHLSDPVVKSALAMQCGNYGLPPERARFILHAAVAGHYFNGGFYPAGGGGALTKAFTRNIRRHGGEIQTQARVDRILIEKNTAIGVRLSDGTELRAEAVISNADPHKTYFGMIGAEYVKSSYRRRLEKMKYSHAAVNVFLIIDADLRELGMDSGNIWYSAFDDLNQTYRAQISDNPFEGEEFPALFLGSPTLKDPSAYDGRYHALEAITFIPYRHFGQFAGSASGDRPEAYGTMKALIEQKIRTTVERILPGINQYIVRCEVGTPLTSSYYVESTEGNSYGTEKTLGQLGPLGFNVFSPIRNLYHVGASTISHGVIGACNSGLIAAAKILGVQGHELLIRDPGQYLRVFPAEDPRSWPDWIQEKQRTRMRRTIQRTVEFQ